MDRVFDVELADFVADGVFREERWPFPVWFFELPGDTVWGATARVLMELLERARCLSSKSDEPISEGADVSEGPAPDEPMRSGRPGGEARAPRAVG